MFSNATAAGAGRIILGQTTNLLFPLIMGLNSSFMSLLLLPLLLHLGVPLRVGLVMNGAN